MGIRWIPAARLPRPPLAVAGVLGTWLVLVSAAAVLEAHTHREPVTCLFRWVTGHPCPTCGSTRLILQVLHGRFGMAFLENPLVFLGLVMASGLLGVRVLTARKPCLQLSPAAQVLGIVLGCLLLVANWLWVLHRA